MAKNFKSLTDNVEKAVRDFTNAAKSNTVLCIMCNKSEYRAFTSGSFEGFPEEQKLKHNERLIRTLAADKRLFDYLYSIVKPVKRFYNRQAK